MGVSAYRRLGSKTAFRHGYNDQEVSTKLDNALRHANTPIRKCLSTAQVKVVGFLVGDARGRLSGLRSILAKKGYDYLRRNVERTTLANRS